MTTTTMTMTMADARDRYYDTYGFGADGGDHLAWVPIQMFGLTVYIPNSDARRRAVRIHDMHHVATGYRADLLGETEIAAWELATGCKRFIAAWVLNLLVLGLGLVIAPRRVVRAWALGRHTRNLYAETGVERVLPRTVDEVRAELGLDRPAPAVRVRDVLAVGAVGVPMLGMLAALAPIGLVVAVISTIIAKARA